MTNRPTPQPGETYRHFKGAEYEIAETVSAGSPQSPLQPPPLPPCENSETGVMHYFAVGNGEQDNEKVYLSPPTDENMVIYFSLDHHKIWARPLSNFMEVIDGPSGETCRFEKVEKA